MEIIPGVHLIRGTFGGVNTYLIVDSSLTLIDTGFPGNQRRIVSYINKLGRSEKEIGTIIITHNHIDHTGSLRAFRRLCQSKVAVHKADTGKDLPYSGTLSRILNLPLVSLLKPVIHNDLLDSEIFLSGGETLPPLGGMNVIHTPGHTKGSISLFSPKKKILFCGDLVNTRYDRLRTPDNFLNFSTSGLIKSIEEISKLDFDVLCVGHGKPIISDASSDVRLLASKLNQPV